MNDSHAGHSMPAGHALPAGQDKPAGHDMPPGRDAPAAHDKHAGHSVAMFRDKFGLSLLLTVPTLVWGHMLPKVFGFHPPAIPGAAWIPAVFGTIVFAYGGWPFLAGAAGELRDRLPGMMTLIALATSVAFVFSAAVALGYPAMPLWEELATLVTIMLAGHWLEMRSISQAQGALGELIKLLPDQATRVRPGAAGAAEALEQVAVAVLAVGDLVLVRPGERVPADGLVRAGEGAVNESMITGESRPVTKHPGDPTIAGTVNGAGSLRVEVTGTGDKTTLAGIMRLVQQAQTSRSRAQALADRAARWLTVIALVAGALTFITWYAVGAGMAFAVERTVATLVIACPHALGLAIPLVVAISTTLAAGAGLLVRDRRGLEEARLVQVVVFDKTGTLTSGEFGVVALTAREGTSGDDALRIAAAVEHDSEHPIAQGLVRTARERGLASAAAEGFASIPGIGARARVGGAAYAIGGPALLRDAGAALPAELQAAVDAAAQRGQAAIVLLGESVSGGGKTDRPLAVFAIADVVRPEAREAIRTLRDAKIEVVMMTGDARAVAESVARDIGIDTVLAEVRPEEKAGHVKRLQATGKRVMMVGDGVNDAPALVTADVGVAIGAGTDVAVEAGDVVLVRSDPRDAARIIALSRATYRKMMQNLFWAAGYNVVAIPLAAGVLASIGVLLSPAVGAALMSLSTVVVALNAQLLRRVRL